MTNIETQRVAKALLEADVATRMKVIGCVLYFTARQFNTGLLFQEIEDREGDADTAFAFVMKDRLPALRAFVESLSSTWALILPVEGAGKINVVPGARPPRGNG